MKKLNFLCIAVFGLLSLGSCIKDNTDSYDASAILAAEAPIIEAYVDSLQSLGILSSNVQLDANTGIWYDLTDAGDQSYTYNFDTSGTSISIEAPNVQVRYTGKLLDGSIFDQNTSTAGTSFSLANTISAWQIAFLPEEIDNESIGGLTTYGLSAGAKIRIITPSYYGYQNVAQSGIPANSPLDFDIEVLDVTAP